MPISIRNLSGSVILLNNWIVGRTVSGRSLPKPRTPPRVLSSRGGNGCRSLPDKDPSKHQTEPPLSTGKTLI